MTISILGCGWLGLPLAERLIETGHRVKGSTTAKTKLSSLETQKIEPYLIRLDPDLQSEQCEEFWNSDILVLNIPPGRRNDNVIDFHTVQIKSVIKRLRNSPVRFVVFASSTSVYPKTGGVMEEKDAVPGKATRNSGEALLKAEQLLQKEQRFATTIIRFGGLYGYDRHPANYISEKKDVPHGNAPVNLIHRDDCVNIISEIITGNLRGEIFNAVSDGHPPKNQYYKIVARQAGVEPPIFQPDSGKDYKVISNRKLKECLNYSFTYPNPLDFEIV